MAETILILGGARSGKSRHAEALVEQAGGRLVYLATAEARDEEMRARIHEHQRRRGDRWQTIEEPLDLVTALTKHAAPECAILVDCLTLWLSNLMGAGRNVDGEVANLVAALPNLDGAILFVSNEVGMGIVPENALARSFRDQAGRLNQQVAAAADRVVFVAAGLPLVLKGPPPGELDP